MKSEFMLAITQLAAEKNLPREVVLEAVEAGLVSAFRKNNFAANQNISVRINPNTGEVTVFAEKTVVETVTDPRRELSLDEAKRIKKGIKLGEAIEVEATPKDAGRIAAQTAKQVVLQRLREAERELVFEEFSGLESEIVTGIVQRIEPRQLILDLGKTEGILANPEQVRTEHYRVGQRLKVYLMEVHRTNRGPQVLVSRTHRNLLRRLLELEVPEIHSGAVELKSIAREAGYRSKIAVVARQPGVDPVGSCVGLRGIRIQNIVNELNGEKIDIMEWHPDPATFIANALSPAQVVSVEVDGEEKTATVVVPDRQLSLAIGKEGQNARLAAKLTGWRIDIKSVSAAEAEKAALAEQALVEIAVEEAITEEPLLVELAEPVTQAAGVEEYLELLAPGGEEEGLPIEEVTPIEEALVEIVEPAPQLRFVEDIFPARVARVAKPDKKAKKGKGKKEEVKEETARPKKVRQTQRAYAKDEYDELEEMLN
ncbi:MAG: transcription termination/antitermination protein NusA [Dehalococcoidia bacterium]|nr:MAG: transcription termination/antitermination protein NusA [Dehalococcoidia bacterium]